MHIVKDNMLYASINKEIYVMKEVLMRIDTIKKDLTNIINQKIKDYSSIIIDSFVEFYGEKYRQIILDRFNNISYLLYN